MLYITQINYCFRKKRKREKEKKRKECENEENVLEEIRTK